MVNTLPSRISAELLGFCALIAPGRPTFIRSKPSQDAQPSTCFDNVARKIDRAGGEIAYGWAIWMIPSLNFEAEHHGVWRNRAGELVDVSPQINGLRKILFLSDPNAIYDPPNFRRNVIKAASDDPRVIEMVDCSNKLNNITCKYRAIGVGTPVSVEFSDHLEIANLKSRVAQLMSELTA